MAQHHAPSPHTRRSSRWVLPVRTILVGINRFIHLESFAGVLLLACAVAAMAWANGPWHETYFHLWEMPVSVVLGDWAFSKTLHHIINDGLMAIFFFVVGLEIKREFLAGELAKPRQALLPILAALGGMLVPAGIYAAFNAGGDGAAGWGIPMATDIAFAVGILAILGSRVPLALKVFLTALAIVDDLGAVLVIALFYSGGISWLHLLAAGGIFAAMLMLNGFGVRRPLPYALLALALWGFTLGSGIHATIAGVFAALAIPARSRIDVEEYLERGRANMARFDAVSREGLGALADARQQDIIAEIEIASEEVGTPLRRIERTLHPWVSFLIMPLFALANAGVGIDASTLGGLAHPVAWGVALGLILGKQVGVFVFAWIGVRLGWAERPQGADWIQVYGVAWLAGIGFTMSLFIANLAFGQSPLLEIAKLAILGASLIAGLVGWTILHMLGRHRMRGTAPGQG